MTNNNQSINANIEEIDLKDIIVKLVHKWYVFVIIGILFLAFAIYYILSTAPIYHTSGTILVQNNSDAMSLASEKFSMASDLLSTPKPVHDEIIILSSKSITKQMVEELDLQTNCYYKKRLNEYYELYQDEPIHIIYPDNFKKSLKGTFIIDVKKAKDKWKIKFTHRIGYNKTKYKTEITDLSKAIETQWGEFKFIEVSQYIDEKYPKYDLRFITKTIYSRVEQYNNEIEIKLSNKKANAISISYEGGNYTRNEAIINKLIELYQLDSYKDININSIMLSDFISKRIQLLDDELQVIEKKVEQYRIEKNLANIQEQSRNAIESVRDYNKLLTEVEMQYTLMTFVEEYIKKSDILDLIPSNTGIEDESLSNLIINYNYQVMEYLRLSRSTNENNPFISQLKDKILLTRENILQTITNIKDGTNLRKDDIIKRNKKVEEEISQVPTIEREFVEVAREQEIKRNLYIFLLQKREETQLAMATANNSGKIVDQAYTSEIPVAPKSKFAVIIAFLLTIVFGIIYVYLESLINNKINDSKALQNITKLPIISSIPHTNSKSYELIKDNDSDEITESFRLLRTGLQLLNNKGKENKVILMTSSTENEGKSFCAINLALSFATLNKKIALVELDMRQPKLADYLNLNNKIGIKEYLTNKNNKEEIKQTHSKYNNLDVYVAGNTVSNPTELLNNSNIEELFKYLRENYEYVIIDSAPVIADTLLLEHLTDTTLFVCRRGMTRRPQIEHMNNLVKNGLLQNVSIILNESSEIISNSYKY